MNNAEVEKLQHDMPRIALIYAVGILAAGVAIGSCQRLTGSYEQASVAPLPALVTDHTVGSEHDMLRSQPKVVK